MPRLDPALVSKIKAEVRAAVKTAPPLGQRPGSIDINSIAGLAERLAVLTAPGSPVAVYAETIGDGVSTTHVVHHGLGSEDVTVTVYRVSDGGEVWTEVQHTSPTTVTVAFALPPGAASRRVVVRK